MTPTPTFEERLAALEAAHIDLNDLPLAALQRKLELDWRPAASVLLGDSSITPGMLTVPVPPAPKYEVVGAVNGGGTVAVGTGFTVLRTGTGGYTVTFTTPFVSNPIIILTVIAASGAIEARLASGVTTSSFAVVAFTTTTGAVIDTAFHFRAIESA